MRLTTCLVAAAVALTGTITLAQNVTYDFDRATNFQGFKTYAWTSGTELEDPLNHARVVNAIESQMAAKGFTKVDRAGHPDVLVSYHASFDRNLEINGFSSGWGAPRFGGSRNGRATVDEIVVGTIVVDMRNAQTNQLVWRGTASREVDVKANPEKREKNIRKAAERLFKHYPPKA